MERLSGITDIKFSDGMIINLKLVRTNLNYRVLGTTAAFVHSNEYSLYASSSLGKVPIHFSPLPLGQVFKLSANMRLTSPASNI